MNNFERFGLSVPEILLPKNIDTASWSVVACDQYTQDKDYWKQVEKISAGKNSTLNLILPEVYLNDEDKAERIQKIKSAMGDYIKEGVFAAPRTEMVYIERTTAYGRVRHGLVAALDLDSYEWKPFSTALVRATEATILERIPPRMEIRRGAPLELPHIMLLANDPSHSLVEAIGEKIKSRGDREIYSGSLMQNSGSIKGWAVESEEDLDSVHSALEKLFTAGTKSEGDTFLFAVGDGNHSLATAKSVWEEEKKKGGANQNVRYALVEIVNIYDTDLTFEPIHRVIFNADTEVLIKYIQKDLGGNITDCDCAAALEQKVKNSAASFGFVYMDSDRQKYVLLETPVKELAVSRLQPVLDKFIQEKDSNGGNLTIDYIHGSEEVFRLGAKENATAILLPPVAKDSFFATIGNRGPLPRKSFSMGEASEKRFYLEARRLF